jgi:hypothetical protein
MWQFTHRTSHRAISAMIRSGVADDHFNFETDLIFSRT